MKEIIQTSGLKKMLKRKTNVESRKAKAVSGKRSFVVVFQDYMLGKGGSGALYTEPDSRFMTSKRYILHKRGE